MHPLSWFDNRTLLACQVLLEVIFCCVLLAFHRAYPALLGTRSLALAFLVGTPGTLLVAMRGHVPFFLSAVVGNLLIYAGLLLLYRGLLQFFHEKRYFNASLIAVGIASTLQVYYALVDDRIVVRIIFICITMCILSWLKCWTLIVHAHRRIHRLLFAAALFLSGIFNLSRAFLTIVHGAPRDYMQQNAIQTYNLIVGLTGLAVLGIFYLTLVYFELTSTIEGQADHDAVAGTLNRRAIERKLSEELARSRRAGITVSVLLVDIDHFKSINDLRGHVAGDEALRLVASSITSVLRRYDTLGRFGGDEFLLVLPETDGGHALLIAERIRETLTRIATTSSLPPITLSIGVTWFERNEEPVDVIARADAALYAAKRAGRDCSRLEAPTPKPTPDNAHQSGTAAPGRPRLSRVASRRRTRDDAF